MIKIEPLTGAAERGTSQSRILSPLFALVNRNKRSLCLDLKKSEVRQPFTRPSRLLSELDSKPSSSSSRLRSRASGLAHNLYSFHYHPTHDARTAVPTPHAPHFLDDCRATGSSPVHASRRAESYF